MRYAAAAVAMVAIAALVAVTASTGGGHAPRRTAGAPPTTVPATAPPTSLRATAPPTTVAVPTTMVPSAGALIPPTSLPDERALFAALMAGSHDGQPEGVPLTWGWAQHSEVENASNAGMSAMTAWGQVYAESGAAEPPPGTVRVEVKDIRSFVWSRRAGRWVVVQDSARVEGSHYRDDFSANDSTGADLRVEPDGGTSVAMLPAYNFHFWPLSGRASVVPGDIAAVITTFDARLIGEDAPDANYVANAGGDWWRTVSAPFDYSGAGGNNDGIGEGRFVRLTTDWATIGFYTGGP